MPLLRKKQFQKTMIPELLRDDEEVFHCQITNEVFRDYDEFCQRIILVNSMIWSCAMTGKTNLTYAEALASEKAAKKNLKDFPVELRIPVLFLATKTKRSAFSDMTEDVFSFIKDRYFVGEIVESSFTENNWRESHVLQVIAPNDEQIEAYIKRNGKSPEKNNFLPSASLFRYEVEQLDANDQDSSQVMIVEANHVRRKKGPYTKEKNRLFLKQFVEMNSQGIIVIKDSIKRKYKLDTVKFDQIFDGALPDFEQSKRIHKPVAVNGKKVRQETLAKYLDKGNHVHNNSGKNLLEEMKRKEKEYKQKVEEMKQKKIEEKEKEKQKRKEENLKMSNYVREWYKPRDDLELEDHKCLPTPTPVQTKIPEKYFGDVLMLLEFCSSFSSFLSTKDFFPGGLTIDYLERALLEKEVAGPLTDLVQMLLTALFNVQEEEKTTNNRSQIELRTDDKEESMTLSIATRLATKALNWSKNFQGVPLRRLPLCPLTVSEVLRLHLLSSGARLSENATKWRYQQRGGYMSEDDPGLHLRFKHPHILKILSIHNMNQLSIDDRIIILTCLVDQLLTYADVRDTIEERIEKSKQLKAELRSLQSIDKKFDQELISGRLKIKRENKGNDEAIKTKISKLMSDLDKKRGEVEHKMKDILKKFSNFNVTLGSDRAYQRYIKIESLPGFFVENDEMYPGSCLDKIVVQKPELIDAQKSETLDYVKKLYEENNGSDKENENGIKKHIKKINGLKNPVKVEDDLNSIRDLMLCTANNHPCPIHSNENKTIWSFYHNKDDVETLISCLNKRGIRESELRQVIESDRKNIENLVFSTNASRLNSTIENSKPVKKVQNKNKYEDSNLGFPLNTDISEVLNLSLIDTILEMEEKIHAGNLGHLRIKDREKWRSDLDKRNFKDLDKTLVSREEWIDKLKKEESDSRSETPDSFKDSETVVELNGEEEINDVEISTADLSEQQIAVKSLATALVQIAQAVEPKHLKKPLGNVSDKKDNRKSILDKWEQSLLCSTSYSQIFLHYCTLDNCIMWVRSVLKARCKICHRLSDPENMLLCDGCNKGYHLYCIKPKLSTVPEGDWFCNKCKPEEPVQPRREAARKRRIFTEESEDEEEQEQEEVEEEEDEEEEEEIENAADITMFEVCEVCGSGGHVICCDFCPKVYHLECTQPPLRRVPRGEWKCHLCKRKSEKNNYSDSGSSEETPQRRSGRRAQEKICDDDGTVLHNVALQELLSDVIKHKDSWPFTKPVTKHEVPDYYDIITKPMDFGKIKYKLNMGEYKNDTELLADAALVFENCDTYNNSEAIVYKCGVRLLKFFEKRVAELGMKFPSGIMGDIDSDTEGDGSTQPKKMRYS